MNSIRDHYHRGLTVKIVGTSILDDEIKINMTLLQNPYQKNTEDQTKNKAQEDHREKFRVS